MEMGEFRHPVYTLDSKADINYGEAQVLSSPLVTKPTSATEDISRDPRNRLG